MFSVGVDSDGSFVGMLETPGAALRPELTSAIRTLDMLSIRPRNRVNAYLGVEVDRNEVQPSLR